MRKVASGSNSMAHSARATPAVSSNEARNRGRSIP